LDKDHNITKGERTVMYENELEVAKTSLNEAYAERAKYLGSDVFTADYDIATHKIVLAQTALRDVLDKMELDKKRYMVQHGDNVSQLVKEFLIQWGVDESGLKNGIDLYAMFDIVYSFLKNKNLIKE